MKVKFESIEVEFLCSWLEIILVEQFSFFANRGLELEWVVVGELYLRKLKEFKIVKSRTMTLKNSEFLSLQRILKNTLLAGHTNIIRNGILDKLNRIKKY